MKAKIQSKKFMALGAAGMMIAVALLVAASPGGLAGLGLDLGGDSEKSGVKPSDAGTPQDNHGPGPELPSILPLCDEPTLMGTVTNLEGDELANISVSAVPQSSSAATGALLTRTTTGEDGGYQLRLRPGDYLVAAVDNGTPPEHRPDYEQDVRVTCDSIRELDFELQPIDHPELPNLGLGDIVATVREFIEGTDVNRSIEAGVELEVSLPNLTDGMGCQYVPELSFSTETTDNEGNATFNNLVPGYYCLRVLDSDWDDAEVQDIQVQPDQTPLVLVNTTKTASESVDGTVEDTLPDDPDPAETEIPIVGAKVTVDHWFYCPYGGVPEGADYPCSVDTDEDGDYEFPKILWDKTDEFTIYVNHTDYQNLVVPSFHDYTLLRSIATVSGITADTITFHGAALHHEDFDEPEDLVWTETTVFTGTDLDDGEVEVPWADYSITIEDGGDTHYRCVSIGPGGLDLSDATGGKLAAGAVKNVTGLSEVLLAFTGDGGDRCFTTTFATGDGDGNYAIGLHADAYTIDFAKDKWAIDSVTEALDDIGDFDVERAMREIPGTIRISESFGEDIHNALSPAVEGAWIKCEHTVFGDFHTNTTGASSDNLGLSLPVADDYTCELEDDDFFPHESIDLDVGPSGSINDVDMILERRNWTIAGTVTDAASGEPVPDVTLYATNLQAEDPLPFQEMAPTDENGTYEFTMEIIPVEGEAKVNAIMILADHLDYAPGTHVALIGSHPAASQQADFQLAGEDSSPGGLPDPEDLIPEDLPDPEDLVPDDLPGPDDLPDPSEAEGVIMGQVPEELNCGGYENVLPWVNQLITDPFCNEDPELPGEGTAMGLIPEELNCGGYDSVLPWVNQIITDPFCNEDPELPLP